MKIKTLSLSIILSVAAIGSAQATPLSNIVINEILANPNDLNGGGFDTDGDGAVEVSDEFVEIYNTSNVDQDVSGLQFWDFANGTYFTVPNGTILGPNGYLVMVAFTGGGSLPTVADGSHAFGADSFFSLSNTADNVIIYDPASDEYIQAIYNGDLVDSPTTDTVGFPNFSSSATLVGGLQDFGFSDGGVSFALATDGDVTNPVPHDMIGDGSIAASPGASNISTDAPPPPPSGDAVTAEIEEALAAIALVTPSSLNIHPRSISRLNQYLSSVTGSLEDAIAARETGHDYAIFRDLIDATSLIDRSFRELSKYRNDPAANAQRADLISSYDDLVDAARALASERIEAAIANGATEYELSSANNAFALGEDIRQTGLEQGYQVKSSGRDPRVAIREYGAAWNRTP